MTRLMHCKKSLRLLPAGALPVELGRSAQFGRQHPPLENPWKRPCPVPKRCTRRGREIRAKYAQTCPRGRCDSMIEREWTVSGLHREAFMSAASRIRNPFCLGAGLLAAGVVLGAIAQAAQPPSIAATSTEAKRAGSAHAPVSYAIRSCTAEERKSCVDQCKPLMDEQLVIACVDRCFSRHDCGLD